MTFTATLGVTSPLTTGKPVADAQWLLKGHSVFKTLFYNGPIDSHYGPLTAAGTHRAKYYLGYAKPDNVFGPILYAYLTGNAKLPLLNQVRRKRRLAAAAAAKLAAAKAAAALTPQEKMLAYAKTFLGYREGSGNMTLFGSWYGMNGSAWCAMACSYWAHHVGLNFHYSYVPNVVSDARSGRNGLYVTNSPKAGDKVCFDWRNDGTFDHIGVFDHWANTATGKFMTVEGNTLPEGGTGDQSNGGGVYARQRGVRDGYRVLFVRETR